MPSDRDLGGRRQLTTDDAQDFLQLLHGPKPTQCRQWQPLLSKRPAVHTTTRATRDAASANIVMPTIPSKILHEVGRENKGVRMRAPYPRAANQEMLAVAAPATNTGRSTGACRTRRPHEQHGVQIDMWVEEGKTRRGGHRAAQRDAPLRGD